MTAFMIPATSYMKLYRYRPGLQKANAYLIPTFVRHCVVVSEAAARAMLLAGELGILPALFLPHVFSVLLMPRCYCSVVKVEKRQKGGGNFWSNSFICSLPPSSFSMAGSEESCCSDLDLVMLIIKIRKCTAV